MTTLRVEIMTRDKDRTWHEIDDVVEVTINSEEVVLVMKGDDPNRSLPTMNFKLSEIYDLDIYPQNADVAKDEDCVSIMGTVSNKVEWEDLEKE